MQGETVKFEKEEYLFVHVTLDLVLPQMITDRRGFNTRQSEQYYQYHNV